MKKLQHILLLMLLHTNIACENANNNKQHEIDYAQKKEAQAESNAAGKDINLPFGNEDVMKYRLPKEWENLSEIDDASPDFRMENTSSKGYDSLFYFIEKKSNALYDLQTYTTATYPPLKLPKAVTTDLEKLYGNSVILDSANYVGQFFKTPNYSLRLYKNGNKYSSNLTMGNEAATFNFLCLITFSNKNIPIDYRLIYYNNYDDVLSYKRLFYVDKEINIYTKDFQVEEIMTKSLGQQRHIILPTGLFKKHE